MREILFRGKRKDNGEWVVSNTFYQCDEKIKLWDEPNRDGYVEIEKDTVGQYTGLTDKNGTKIFEGDIVKWNINYAIVWQGCKFVLKKDINAKSYDYVLSCFDGTEFEIIGNIHDNPELVRGEEE